MFLDRHSTPAREGKWQDECSEVFLIIGLSRAEGLRAASLPWKNVVVTEPSGGRSEAGPKPASLFGSNTLHVYFSHLADVFIQSN